MYIFGFPYICKYINIHIYMCVHDQSLSHVQLFVTLWTHDLQAPLSMGSPKQEYWHGLSFPSPGNLPYPGIKPMSPVTRVLVDRFSTTEPPGRSYMCMCVCVLCCA